MDHEDPLERLSELVRTSRRELVAAARREGLSAEDALEVVQDALATFVSRSEAGTAPDEARASVLVTVKNAARNARRRHHRALPHVPVDDEPSAGLSVEEILAHAEDVVRLRACVAELCSVQRAVITLRLLEERSGADVAEELGLTRGHVDVLVHRAKASLRVCMVGQR